MTKHLTIPEKLNAENELKDNVAKIKALRNEIKLLNRRNQRLRNHLYSRYRSKHNGMFGIDGLCFKMFEKKAKDLTVEERRQYDNTAKAIRKKKLNKTIENK